MSKKIFIASDHAGLDYKNKVKEYLINNNFEVVDFGNSLYNDLDDYPDFLHEAGRALSLNNEDSLSIVFGGSGVGESVLMNRYKKVRCLPVFINDVETILKSSEHDNINAIAIGARFLKDSALLDVVDAFLRQKKVSGEKYIRRIRKIDNVLL